MQNYTVEGLNEDTPVYCPDCKDAEMTLKTYGVGAQQVTSDEDDNDVVLASHLFNHDIPKGTQICEPSFYALYQCPVCKEIKVVYQEDIHYQ